MLEVRQEILDLIPLKDTTTGQDMFDALEAVMQNFDLPWELLTSVATDGAPSMTGEISGLAGCVQRKMKEHDLVVIPYIV